MRCEDYSPIGTTNNQGLESQYGQSKYGMVSPNRGGPGEDFIRGERNSTLNDYAKDYSFNRQNLSVDIPNEIHGVEESERE